jgi:hypothetical protein
MLNAMRVGSVVLVMLLTVQVGLAGDPNMLGWWPLSEGVGDMAVDVSGNGNDGVIAGENGGWVEDADFGTALYFGSDANGLFVDAGEIPQMTLENGFTWAFWANQNPALAGLNQIVLGNRYNPEGTDYAPRQFIKFTPTKFEWHMNGNGNDNMEYSAPMVAEEWTHHAVVKDANELTYFRNGMKDAEKVITQALDSPMPLYFGGDGHGRAGENWMGMLSDMRLFTEALTSAQLADVLPVVLDDFEGDPNLPEWTIATGPDSVVVAVDPLDPNNQALLGRAGDLTMSQPLVVDPNGMITFGFKILYEDLDPNVPGDVMNNLVIGLGDGAGTAWSNLYALVRLGDAGERLDFRNGGAYETMVEATEPLTWYSIIMDIDSANKTYDIYVDGLLLVDDAAFRSQDPGGIQRVLIKQNGDNAGLAYVDDVVIGIAVPEQIEPKPVVE